MLQQLSPLLDRFWENQQYRELVHHCPDRLPDALPLPEQLHCLLRRAESFLQLQDGTAARDHFLDLMLLLERGSRTLRKPELELSTIMGLIRANRLVGEPEKSLQLLERLRLSRTSVDTDTMLELLLEEGWCLLAAEPEKGVQIATRLAGWDEEQLSEQAAVELLLLKAAIMAEEQLTAEALQLLLPLRESSVKHLLTRAQLAGSKGGLLLELQRYREALDSLKRAEEVYDHYHIYHRLIEIRALRARAMFRLGDRRDATRTLRSARSNAYELDLPVSTVTAVAEEFSCDTSSDALPLSALVTTRELPGFSSAIREVNERIYRMGRTALPVLILGETGVGKELAARALHERSYDGAAQLVTIHCPSLSESLFESTLFGHRRGSFTGATSDRSGLVEQAEKGTLFLDEISEISPALQAKLLRFLESGEYHPVGSNQMKRAEVRLLTASNRSYQELLHDVSFRSDLLHRIAGTIIELPPLRKRREDIPLLLTGWLEEWNEAAGVKKVIAPATVTLLQQYSFPGNVRELRHLFQNAWEQARSSVLPEHFQLESLPAEEGCSDRENFQSGPLRPALRGFEKRFLEQTLHEVRFDKSHASRLLQISRQTLYTKLRQYGLLENSSQ